MTDIEKKRDHLAAIDAFIASPAMSAYKAAVNKEIDDTRNAIVAVEPDSLENFVEQCRLRGDLRTLESRLTMFEDARVSLNDRIDEMVEAELQNATETKK